MLSLTRTFLRVLPLLFFVTGLFAQKVSTVPDYGLSFASHEVIKDQRTSLNLTPEAPFDFDNGFELSFNLSFHRLTNAYGYVVRIIANDSVNIDLLSSPEHSEFHDMGIIVNNKQTDIQYEFLDVKLQPALWTPVRIAFSPQTNQITVTWNGVKKTQAFPVSQLKTFRFFFGANDFGRFNTADVPPMSIKDVVLRDNDKVAAQWELKRHAVNEVYDSQKDRVAPVKNPTWLIDRHIKWVHRKNFVIGKYPGVAFNGKDGILYASDVNGVYTLNLQHGEIQFEKNTAGNAVHTDANQLLYVEQHHALINYDVFTNTLSHYNPERHTWTNHDTAYHEPNYWHNNKFYNAANSKLYAFGGYGFFSYKNAFWQYDTVAAKWVNLKTKGTIPPRYLGASGVTAKGDKVLIFGGYGSQSGKQELSPQSFYDLYTFDMNDHSVKKLWEFPEGHSAEDLVFSNSLVINEADSCFYVLSFPKNKYESHIKLRRYALRAPETEVLADSIPFRFHDEHSFCDLFLSRATNELVAVTAHKEKGQYKVDVYTINYPPLRTQDVLQQPVTASAAGYYVVLAFGIGALVLFIVLRKKSKAPTVQSNIPAHDAVHDIDFLKKLHEEKPVATVNLFGGFQVFDKTGHDITGKFTMTLKELFVLILLHSVKNEKGISTTELQEYLWPDKDEVSARNNRNVNIKKLRTLLEEIGNITIENNNSYLRLDIGPEVFCDYQAVFKILNADSSAVLENQKIELLLKYVKRGSLLPNLQTGWLDNFKSDISNRVIDALLAYSAKLDTYKDDKILLDIADAIFNYDTINQEALVIKCSVLNKKGKYSLARTWYDHFVKEYKNLYAENYPKTFDDVIS